MHSTRKGSSKRSEEALDDDSDDRDSKRKSRNLSEKKRRDQFNMLVNELNSMISSGSRKMDKSTVLKSTISYLKNHNEIAVRSRVNEIQESWKPTFLSNEEFAHLVLEAVDGFIIACSTYGKIYYVSETVTSLLGHLPKNIIQKSIYDFTFEEDHKNIYSVLLNTKEHKEHASFLCHVQRGDHESKMSNFYELVRFSGYVRFVDDPLTNSSTNSCNDFNDRYVFVGTVRLERPQLLREIPLVDSSKSEFTSRHSLEWKFLFLDPRAPPIIGYLPFELLGTSGFDYYHIDDLEKVTKCHESLMQKGEGTSCYYRFLTKGQQWIWLQTRFYISYHQWNSKPEFIVCTHRVVNFVDVNDANLKKENGQDYISSDSFRSSFKQEKSAKSVLLSGPESEGTSISADSLTSKNSTNTQQSKKSNCGPQPSNIQEYSNPQEQSQVSYDNTAPVKRTLSVPTAVISPPKQNVENDSTQTQLQADLQRKHAELQVIIDQQQAELRRVSEQLLMARLGLLSTGNETNSNLESIRPTSNSETVTSTNGILMEPSTTPSIASLNVSNQPDSIFSSADSNTSPKPN